MANKIYQLPYDDIVDKDIHEWLGKLPRNRKAEMVRNAIRFYISCGGNSKSILAPGLVPQSVVPKKQEIEEKIQKKRPNLSKDGSF